MCVVFFFKTFFTTTHMYKVGTTVRFTDNRQGNVPGMPSSNSFCSTNHQSCSLILYNVPKYIFNINCTYVQI